MKIGVYGGTFDPPHLGHMEAARAAAEALGLDKLLLIPAAVPPHKALPPDAVAPQARLAMAAMVADGVNLELKSPGLAEASAAEMDRTGKSYTADTLAQLRERYPEDELWLLLGTDMFLSLQTWREPEKIISLAGIAAFDRTEADSGGMEGQARRLRERYGARVALVRLPRVMEISSTQVRELLVRNRVEARALLWCQVYGYILREHLYQTHVDLRHLPLSQLRPVALSYLKYKRIPHVLGTEQEAIRLAERYGADVQKARVAALLHDCTKKLNMEEQLALCKRYGIELDELEKEALKLLHAKTGAAIARDVFGVDEEIYQAIWWHTTGHAGMTALEKVMYLADYIEPSRDFPGVEELRHVCYEDLDKGLLMGLEMTIQEMTAMGNPVHRATIEARDALKG